MWYKAPEPKIQGFWEETVYACILEEDAWVAEWSFWENSSWHGLSYFSHDSITVEETEEPAWVDGLLRGITWRHEDQNQLAMPTWVDQTSSNTFQRYGYSDRSAYNALVPYQTHSVVHQENCVPHQISRHLLQNRICDHDHDLYHVQSTWQTDQ